jgi:aryl-alcohol dehydrogenase-like predicted oxidoreductase
MADAEHFSNGSFHSDLLQFHNVSDPQQSLAQFKDWKAEGVCRYIGITSTRHADFPAIEAVLTREKPDFVQIDYSLDDREAERRILPAAAEVKAAMLTALPFGRARLFSAVRGKEIPDWARGFAGSWGQFFLKYLLADPRVTAVIPGTADPAHITDNAGAMRGPLPDLINGGRWWRLPKRFDVWKAGGTVVSR